MKLRQGEGGVWFVHFIDRSGKDRCISTDTTDAALAQEAGRHIEQLELYSKKLGMDERLYNAFVLGSGRHPTLRELIDLWGEHMRWRLTKRYSKLCVQSVQAWLSSCDLMDGYPHQITEQSLFEFINRRKSIRYTSRKTQLQHLVSFCAWLVSRGHLRDNPAESIRIDVDRLRLELRLPLNRRAYAEEEIMKVIKVCNEIAIVKTHVYDPRTGNHMEGVRRLKPNQHDMFLKDALLLMWETGLRISDACLMKWEYLDLPGEKMTVPQHKTKRIMRCAISPRLVEMFNNVERYTESAFVWPYHASLYHSDEKSLREQFALRCKRAGVEYLGFHSIRRSAAQRKLIEVMRQQPPWAVAKVQEDLGHSSPRATSIYLNAPAANNNQQKGL